MECVGAVKPVRRGGCWTITLPKYCLRELGWEQGDVLKYTVLDDETTIIILEKASDTKDKKFLRKIRRSGDLCYVSLPSSLLGDGEMYLDRIKGKLLLSIG